MLLLCEKLVFDVLPYYMYICIYVPTLSLLTGLLCVVSSTGFGQTQPQQWHELHSQRVLCLPE